MRITKRTESLLTWRAKQRQRAVAVANRQQETVVERPVRPVCKYYLNGMCKNVSALDILTQSFFEVIIYPFFEHGEVLLSLIIINCDL